MFITKLILNSCLISTNLWKFTLVSIILFNLCVNIWSFDVDLCKVCKITAIFFIARMLFRAGRSGPAALVLAGPVLLRVKQPSI